MVLMLLLYFVKIKIKVVKTISYSKRFNMYESYHGALSKRRVCATISNMVVTKCPLNPIFVLKWSIFLTRVNDKSDNVANVTITGRRFRIMVCK